MFCAAVVLASMQVGLAGRAGAVCAQSAPDPLAAYSMAQSCSASVEDLSRRSDTTQVFANADGTWSLSVAAEPVRVQQPSGSWTPVDLTLHSNGDGTVSPAASPVPTVLSAGDAAAMAKLSAGGGTLTMGWPGNLPAPVLSGAQATYPEVLPGVDLVVSATEAGADEVLVVKTPAAASNPALAQLQFSVAAQGLALAVSNGGLTASDASGTAVLAMGPPLMWDSTAPPVTSGTDDPAGGDAATSDVSGPGASAKQAAMPMQLSGGTLLVTPVASMLAAADTRYPVYLDPAVSVTRSSWAMINSRFPSQEYWDYDRAEHAKVGWTNKDTKGNTVPSMVYRSLFQFGTSSFRGKHILGAAVTDYLLHSWSCTDSVTELHQSSQSLGVGTTWNSNAGSWGGTLATISDNNCHDAGGVQPQWTSAALTSAVASVAAGSASYLTLGLKATDESSTAGWKKFDENNAKLNVTYNSYPDTPSSTTIDGKACGTGTNPAYVSTLGGHNPVLKAKLTDADAADHLTGTFSWTTSGATATGSQANIANGQYAQVATAGTAFTPGTAYSYTVSAYDGRDSSKTPAGPCSFVADNLAPNTRPTVGSADGRYPCDNGAGNAHDGIGKPGQFTFGPNGASDAGVNDVVGYLYGLGVFPPVTPVAAATLGGSATASVTPTNPGINDLYVRSVDRAGNVGPVFDCRFYVAGGTPAVHSWAFGEGAGGFAADTGASTRKQSLLLGPGTGWTAGRLVGSNAGAFNGSSASASTTTGPVLTTTTSFSVSAWVLLTNTGVWASVLGQQGSHVSGALLQHTPSGGWTFTDMTADTKDPAVIRATDSSNAVANVWTHLAGVYDASAHQIRLYVNGALRATATATISWSPTGQFVVGREWFDDNFVSYFPGDIAEVQVYDRVLGDGEIAVMAAPTLVAQWDMDEGSGATSADSAPDNLHTDLTIGGGTTWTAAGHNSDLTGDPGGLRMNGSGYADTAGPAVRTDQSFTVTAWVNLDGLAHLQQYPSGPYPNEMVVAAKGVNVHAFQLGWSGASQKWVFRTVASDVTGTGGSTLTASTGTMDSWTFLVGVWNATTSQMSFYVNGVLQATGTVGTPINTTGSVTVGRSYDGTYGSYLMGQVDDVRLYAGALSQSDISALYNQ
jgi:hypothetical protein